MKKQFFLIAAAAALTLSSCSNDELIQESESQAIGFDTFVNKTTRAAATDMSNLKDIDVWGYYMPTAGGAASTVFTKQRVTKQASGEWTYSPVRYWNPSSKYFFTALGAAGTYAQLNNIYQYTDHADHAAVTGDFYGCGSVNYLQSKAEGNTDLIYAYDTKETPATMTTSPGKVEFTFKHALSRVHFTFVNGMGSTSYIIRISNLKITNATAQATMTFGAAEVPAWSGHTGTTEVLFFNNFFTDAEGQVSSEAGGVAGSSATNNRTTSGDKYLIPCTAELKIDFTVELLVDGNSSPVATYNHSGNLIPETEFASGFSYNFVDTITPQNINPEQELYPIEFNVAEITPWEDFGDITAPIPGTDPAN